MLIIFSGLPGSGKSTIAQLLAQRLKALYLRVDTIEQAILSASKPEPVTGPEGYFVIYALARENLKLGTTVITDSVNDTNQVRNTFCDIALSLNVPFLEVEILCSDQKQHRDRVEQRSTDIPGFTLPDWNMVINRHYEPWERRHLQLDSAYLSAGKCVDEILAAVTRITVKDQH